MKKILIILEGIASSGKTTLLEKLENLLSKSHRVKSFTEKETLMSIAGDKSFETADKLMNKLLVEFQTTDASVIITDRYHFSHMFRTEKNFESISDIEKTLMDTFSPYIFLLTVQEEAISGRVQNSWNRRGKWLGKSGTIEEKTRYYTEQQTKMREFAKQSKIPVTEINTTNMDWPVYVKEIINNVNMV